jgi:diguanylate cyclase (GGDEF)-like protein
VDAFVRDVVVSAATAGVVLLGFIAVPRFVPRWVAGRGTKRSAAAPEEALVDPVSGLATRRAWNDIFRREEDRLARYRRPVTLMVAELDGIDSFAAALGQGVADYLIPPMAAAMLRNSRDADFLARAGYGRFYGLLPETDEVAATNYMERIRAECDTWLAACAVSIRLAIGWAQPLPGEQLADAQRVAENRMNADRRRYDFHGAPGPGMSVMGADESNPPIPPRRPPMSPTPDGQPERQRPGLPRR